MTNRRDAEILRAAADGRLHIHTSCGEQHASYDEGPDDHYDGSLCTDEVNDLMYAGLLRAHGRRINLTSLGRARLNP